MTNEKLNFQQAIERFQNWKIDKSNTGYFKLYNGFAKAAVAHNLSKSEILVYLLLCERSKNDTGVVELTTGKLSKISGIPKQTIDNSLKKLSDKGLIHRNTIKSAAGYSVRKIVVLPYDDYSVE